MTYDEMKEFLESIGGLVYYNDSIITNPKSLGVSEGWYGLIKELIDELIKLGWDRKITQVKEKFGKLCFYILGGSQEMREIVYSFEKKSGTICEICGEPGKVRYNGWYKTLCENHKREGDK